MSLQLNMEGTINPLLLDVVLNKVFDHLSLQQLLVCRLVCRCWCSNPSLKSLIRQKSVVNLRTIFLHTGTTSENIQNYFSSGSIYSTYNFEDISYQNHFISNFFQTIGPSIISLKLLLNLQQLNITQFRELIYSRLPNLQLLNIYNLSHEEVYSKPLLFQDDKQEPEQLEHRNLSRLQFQETRTPIPQFMTELLSTLPNLREISLKVGICRDWIEQADLWRENSSIATSVIKGLESTGAFRTLKVFRCGKLRLSHFSKLLEMSKEGLHLEILQLHSPHKDSQEVFTSFLESQSQFLKQLILFEQRSARHKRRQSDGNPSGFILNLPQVMPQLELLQLSKHYKSLVVPLGSVSFSKYPKLRKLIFLGQYPLTEQFQVSLNGEGSNINKIVMWNRVSEPSYAIELGSFKALSKLNVRYPSCDFLSALWKTCAGLKELELILEEDKFLDEAMTGIDEAVISVWFGKAGVGLDIFKDIIEADISLSWKGENEISCISNMKELRILRVTVEHNEDSERQAISDVTAYLALGKLISLGYLELYTSHWRMGLMECLFLSKECQAFLRTHLNKSVIHFTPMEGD